MLALILSLLGIGGGVGALAFFCPGLLSAALAFLRGIPKQAWYVIGAIAAAAALFFAHQHIAHKAIAAAKLEQKTADDTAWKAALAKAHSEALAWKAKADQQAISLANNERKLHDQAVADNAALAHALSVRGPGAASAGSCRQGNNSGAPAAPGGSKPAAATSSTAASAVPAEDWAIVPWSWLTRIAQEHDDMRDALQRIFDNDAKQRAAWPGKAAPTIPHH